MRYLMILKADQPPTPPPPELMDAIMKLGADATAAGALLDTAGLLPSVAGVKVSLAGGELSVTDGPFAEAKEHLAGYYLLDTESIERATEIVTHDPAARFWAVEVRPIMDMAGSEM
jgi:hypothetical protein